MEHDLTLDLYRQLAQRDPDEAAQREYRSWVAFEQRWLRTYEGVWAVSDDERCAILRHGRRRADRTFTIPNGVDTLRFQPCHAVLPALEILFVGSFRHLPNILGFEKLYRQIMPLVWAHFPGAVLRVVAGPNHERFWRMLRPVMSPPPDQIDGRVDILGYVEDLRPLYARAAVVVAPLAVSSGTNIKVLEAMACGKAIVSTRPGCAGLNLRDGYDVFLCEDDGEFARTVCRLLGDPSLRREAGNNARRTVEERFAWDAMADRAFHSYLTVLGRKRPGHATYPKMERQCTP